MKTLEFHAMGCGMAAFIDLDSPRAAHMLEKVPDWFEEWEQSLSRFRLDSELNRLNQRAGQVVPVSPVLWDVTCAALQAARWTQGLVVPTILPALEKAGYNLSFEYIQASGRPDPTPCIGTAGGAGWNEVSIDSIRMDEDRRAVELPPGAKLDLGGIAKGWAAQEAARRLGEVAPALVDASGDIATSGPRPDGSPWLVDVADPLQVEDNLGLLALNGGGVATSGIDYRRWLVGGQWKHHIINPRTGEPADTDLLSVTVVAPDALQAEAAAKAVLIQGSRAGMDWLEMQPGLAGLLALQDGSVIYSQSMELFLRS